MTILGGCTVLQGFKWGTLKNVLDKYVRLPAPLPFYDGSELQTGLPTQDTTIFEAVGLYWRLCPTLISIWSGFANGPARSKICP